MMANLKPGSRQHLNEINSAVKALSEAGVAIIKETSEARKQLIELRCLKSDSDSTEPVEKNGRKSLSKRFTSSRRSTRASECQTSDVQSNDEEEVQYGN